MTTSVTVLSSIPGAAAGQIIQCQLEMIADPGIVSVPGLKAGDIPFVVINVVANTSDPVGNFEATVSSDDQILQKVGDAPSGGRQTSILLYRPL